MLKTVSIDFAKHVIINELLVEECTGVSGSASNSFFRFNTVTTAMVRVTNSTFRNNQFWRSPMFDLSSNQFEMENCTFENIVFEPGASFFLFSKVSHFLFKNLTFRNITGGAFSYIISIPDLELDPTYTVMTRIIDVSIFESSIGLLNLQKITEAVSGHAYGPVELTNVVLSNCKFAFETSIIMLSGFIYDGMAAVQLSNL